MGENNNNYNNNEINSYFFLTIFQSERIPFVVDFVTFYMHKKQNDTIKEKEKPKKHNVGSLC